MTDELTKPADSSSDTEDERPEDERPEPDLDLTVPHGVAPGSGTVVLPGELPASEKLTP